MSLAEVGPPVIATCRFCGEDFEITACEGTLALFVWVGGCYDCYASVDAVRRGEVT